MAFYDYECKKCGHNFTARQSFAEHDRHEQVKCPKCGAADAEQKLMAAHARTARKS